MKTELYQLSRETKTGKLLFAISEMYERYVENTQNLPVFVAFGKSSNTEGLEKIAFDTDYFSVIEQLNAFISKNYENLDVSFSSDIEDGDIDDIDDMETYLSYVKNYELKEWSLSEFLKEYDDYFDSSTMRKAFFSFEDNDGNQLSFFIMGHGIFIFSPQDFNAISDIILQALDNKETL